MPQIQCHSLSPFLTEIWVKLPPFSDFSTVRSILGEYKPVSGNTEQVMLAFHAREMSLKYDNSYFALPNWSGHQMETFFPLSEICRNVLEYSMFCHRPILIWMLYSVFPPILNMEFAILPLGIKAQVWVMLPSTASLAVILVLCQVVQEEFYGRRILVTTKHR